MREYFCAYHSMLDATRKLSDAEVGRLFRGLLHYSMTEEQPDNLQGREEIVFDVYAIQIDRDKKLHPGIPSGKDHWNWKGGITPKNQIERNSTDYRIWRKAVFQRDNYTCVRCGKRGGKLNAHHLLRWSQYPEYRFEITNGITLCERCHRLEHKKE